MPDIAQIKSKLIYWSIIAAIISAGLGYTAHLWDIQRLHHDLLFRAQSHAKAFEFTLHELKHTLLHDAKTIRHTLASPEHQQELFPHEEALIFAHLKSSYIESLNIYTADNRLIADWPETETPAISPISEHNGWSYQPRPDHKAIVQYRDNNITIVSTVNIAAMTEYALAMTPPAGLHIQVEHKQAAQWQRIYAHQSRRSQSLQDIDPALPVFREIIDSDLGQWRISSIPAHSFRADYHVWLGWIVGIGGFAFGLLMILFLFRQMYLRQISNELAEQRLKYIESGSAMLNAISSSISMVNHDGTYAQVNQAFGKLHGIATENVPGSHIAEIWGKQTFTETIEPALKRCLEGHIIGREFKQQLGERTHYYESVMHPYEDAGKIQGAVIVTSEITHRKMVQKREKHLINAEMQRQRLTELGMLTGGISHDINNLMTAIVGHAELLPLEERNPKQRCGAIIEAAEKAAGFCRQLEAYAGQGRFELRSIQPCRHIHSMVDMLRQSIDRKTEIHLNLEPDCLCIKADSGQFEQVMVNLITNASDAMNGKPGDIHIRCHTVNPDDIDWDASDQDKPEHALLIEVEDNGCGMSEHTCANIFKPFFSTKDMGTGMGLAAVQGIVQSHGAVVQVHSSLGRGSTFRIFWPAVQKRTDKPPSANHINTDNFSGKVLLCDDEADLLILGQNILEHFGFEVITAADGKEAVELFKEYRNDIRVTLLDINMPRMDGHAAMRAIRRMEPYACIILCSGYGKQKILNDSNENMPNAFVEKPYRMKTIRNALREALGQA